MNCPARAAFPGTGPALRRLYDEQYRNGPVRSGVMKNVNEANPKNDFVQNSNTEKEPDDWVSGDDPMTGAQASYLKTLSEECGESDVFQSDLAKLEASKRIDALKAKRRPMRHGRPS